MSDKTRELVKTLTTDKKKLFLMLSLVAVGLLLWGRLLLKRTPTSALANPQAVQVVAAPSSGNPVVARANQTVCVDLPTKLDRDIFALDTSLYEKIEIAEPEPEKFVMDETDEMEEEDDNGSNLNMLTLNATTVATAVVNNQVVRPGQVIEGFKVVRILNRAIILEKDGEQVQLNM